MAICISDRYGKINPHFLKINQPLSALDDKFLGSGSALLHIKGKKIGHLLQDARKSCPDNDY